jgi:hypothetical protein
VSRFDLGALDEFWTFPALPPGTGERAGSEPATSAIGAGNKVRCPRKRIEDAAPFAIW